MLKFVAAVVVADIVVVIQRSVDEGWVVRQANGKS
jgi:hypothetical protein